MTLHSRVALLILAAFAVFGQQSRAQLCDIVVQGTPSISPNPVAAGSSITVSYTIKNQGAASAGASQTKIQIKNSSGTQVTAPTFSEGSLSAGSSANRSRTVTIPSGSAAGTYTAYVILDNLSQLNQSNTANDLTPGVNFSVTAPVLQCDIVVQGTPGISPNPVTAGNDITVSYTIKNQGAGNAGTSQTKVQIKNSSGTQITAPTFSEGSLSAGASANRSRTVTIPSGSAAGTYTAYVILDNLSQLDESNTANDLTPGVNFSVTAPVLQCDIVVQGTPGISPNPVTAGNDITVSYTIKNQGAGNAGTSQTKIQIKNSSGTQVAAPTFSEGSLSAGASANRSRTVTIPSGSAAGTYTAYVILDNLSQLDESNTANDLTPGVNFSVTAPVLQCDIVVQGTPGISPNPVTAGNDITVSYTIKNQGAGNAGASQTKIQIKNSSGTQIVAPTYSEDALSAGTSASRSRTVTIPSGSAAGTYTAYVILDNLSQLDESNTANDLTPGVNFSVTAPVLQCDIVVQGTPGISPNPVTAGNDITVSYTIKNQGAGNAGASQTKIQIKNSSGTQIVAPTYSEDALSAGTSASRNRTVTIPSGSAAGTYTAYVVLDNLSQLDESNTANDLTPGVNFSVTAPVLQCDIVVQGTPTISPDPVTAGNDMIVNYTILNQSDGNAGSSETKIQIKNSSGNQVTAPSFSEASLPAGSSASRSRTVTIPAGSAAGTYRVYVILDNQSDLDQSNTANDYAAPAFVRVTSPNVPPQFPNLAFSGSLSASVSQSADSAPSRLNVSATVQNTGSSPCDTWRSRLRLLSLSGTVLFSSSSAHPTLNAGLSTTVTFSDVALAGQLASGTFRAEVTLDSDSSISESIESDNVASAQFLVTPTSAGTAGEPSWTRWVPALYYTEGRTAPIDSIVIHTTDAGTYDSNVRYFSEHSAELDVRQVSAHYVLGPSGDVTQMVPLSDTAHHATYYNPRSIGIEVVGYSSDSATWTPTVYEYLRKLVDYLASRFSIPLVHPSGDAQSYPKLMYDQPGIVGHQQVQPIANPSYPWSAKPDPGPHFNWSAFMDSVAAGYQQAQLEIRSSGSGVSPSQYMRALGLRTTLADSLADGPSLRIELPVERYIVIESSSDLVTWTVEDIINPAEGISDVPLRLHQDASRMYRLRWGLRE
jgi:uncharacterized membrane protein/N-acetyl-anhydromuramyl-L-alanine amidase AmpD